MYPLTIHVSYIYAWFFKVRLSSDCMKGHKRKTGKTAEVIGRSLF
jgi:hypothetical protein